MYRVFFKLIIRSQLIYATLQNVKKLQNYCNGLVAVIPCALKIKKKSKPVR